MPFGPRVTVTNPGDGSRCDGLGGYSTACGGDWSGTGSDSLVVGDHDDVGNSVNDNVTLVGHWSAENTGSKGCGEQSRGTHFELLVESGS